MIEIRNLTFAYPSEANLFESFSLTVERGERCSVIGPSGCGKTTLLYLLSRLLIPEGGEIRIDGQISRRPRPETGLVLQDHGLLPWSTAGRNVALGFDLRRFYGPDGLHAPPGSRLDREAVQEIVQTWLQRLGIEALRHKYPNQLSRGQRQRTALARTLALAPDLLLMDEPFSALDAPTRKDLQDLVIELNREQGLTCLTVTHSIEEAVFMGQKILILSRATNRDAVVVENPSSAGFQPEAFQEMCTAVSAQLGSTP